MLVLCVAFALLTVGFVLPCVLDIATTPQHLFDYPSRRMWLVVTIAFWAFGATVWLLVGRREIQLRRAWDEMTDSWIAASGPRSRHQTGRYPGADNPFGNSRRGRQAAVAPVRFIAPDDNPDFLLELDRRIQGLRDGE